MLFANNPLISTKELCILEEAEKYGITWEQMDASRLFRLTWKNHTEYFYGSFGSTTSLIGYLASLDKRLTRLFLSEANVPIPKGHHLTFQATDEEVSKIFESLSKPVVVKLSHGNNGSDVSTNLTSLQECQAAINKVRASSTNPDHGIVVEEQVKGAEYRICATRDEVIAILTRTPANVIGDGHHTITELIAQKNQHPLRNINPTHNDPFPHIKIDIEMEKILSEQELTPTSVPAAGRQVWLRRVSNISQGGDSKDFTDIAHPSVAAIALKTIRALPGLTFAGIDFMTTDITRDQSKVEHHVIEVNAGPHISIHHYPLEGQSRNVALALLRLMFPELPTVPTPDQV